MTAPKPLPPAAAPPRNKFLLPVVVFVSIGTLAAANYFTSAAVPPNTDEEEAAPPAATASTNASAPPTVRETPLPDQNYLENPKGAAERMRRLARETGGDWNKLSPNDQRLFQSVSSGRGREMLRGQAEQFKKGAARGKAASAPHGPTHR